MKFFTCNNCICMDFDKEDGSRYCKALDIDMTGIFRNLYVMDSESYVHDKCPLKPNMTILELYQLIS